MVKLFCGLLIFFILPCYATSLRDPTRPNVSSASKVPVSMNTEVEFTVSSIILRKGVRVAVVNGQPVREGDQIDGAYIARIEANRVRLVMAGEPMWITNLAGLNIKTKR